MIVQNQYSFPNPFQEKTIAANSKAVVWEMNRINGTAFIKKVGITLPNSNCKFQFLVDGQSVEEGDITHQIGQINQPENYDPPLVARKKIQFIGINDGATEEKFEVVCHGFIIRDEKW